MEVGNIPQHALPRVSQWSARHRAKLLQDLAYASSLSCTVPRNDREELAHVHVKCDRNVAKFRLELQRTGFRRSGICNTEWIIRWHQNC